MNIGYARVSTKSQNFEGQIKALKEAGCEENYIFSEKVSSIAVVRVELEKAMDKLREGDVFIVWRLDRLGRKTLDVLKFIEELERKGVKFRSIMEGMDTSTPMGVALITMSAVFAEMEHNLIRERTIAGIEIAKENGRRAGPKKKLTDKSVEMAITLLETADKDGNRQTYTEIAKSLGVAKSTLSRRVAAFKAAQRVVVVA